MQEWCFRQIDTGAVGRSRGVLLGRRIYGVMSMLVGPSGRLVRTSNLGGGRTSLWKLFVVRLGEIEAENAGSGRCFR